MKRLLLLLTVALLLGIAFFVAWPSWAVYEIYSAIQAKDAAALERKIDLPSVRASLRSAAADKIAQLYVPTQSGPTSPVLAERLKREAVERLVGNALENVVTPYSLLLLVSEGGPLKAGVERLLRDQMGRADAPKKVGPVTTLAPGQAGTKSGAGSATPAAPKRGPVVRTISSEDFEIWIGIGGCLRARLRAGQRQELLRPRALPLRDRPRQGPQGIGRRRPRRAGFHRPRLEDHRHQAGPVRPKRQPP